MKVSDYKAYAINLDYETFSIEGVNGFYAETMKQVRAKIDAIVAAESKEGFPIEVVSADMKVGKLTSFNREEDVVWFSTDKGRTKAQVLNYSKRPNFFKATPENLEAVRKYRENESLYAAIQNEQYKLCQSLTNPLSFPLPKSA